MSTHLQFVYTYVQLYTQYCVRKASSNFGKFKRFKITPYNNLELYLTFSRATKSERHDCRWLTHSGTQLSTLPLFRVTYKKKEKEKRRLVLGANEARKSL